MQISVRDAARYLNVPEETVYRWISDGVIPFTRVSDQCRLSSTELMEWASARGIHLSVDMVRELHRDGGAPDFVGALAAGGVHSLRGATTRDEVLTAIVTQLPLADESEREILLEMVLAREVLGSTGIGESIAIPHVRAPIVVHGAAASISVWYLDRPVDFKSPDGRGIETVFLVVTPSPRIHLHLLSRIASALHEPGFRQAIKSRAEVKELLALAMRLEGGHNKRTGNPNG